MKKLKTIGYIALEKVGEEIVVYSLKLFKTAKDAKDFIKNQKNTETIKELLIMVEPIFMLKKLVRRLGFVKSYKDRQIIKVQIKKYFNELDNTSKDFVESFLKETQYFLIPSISVSNNNLYFEV
jgi:hypothetical protein